MYLFDLVKKLFKSEKQKKEDARDEYLKAKQANKRMQKAMTQDDCNHLNTLAIGEAIINNDKYYVLSRVCTDGYVKMVKTKALNPMYAEQL